MNQLNIHNAIVEAMGLSPIVVEDDWFEGIDHIPQPDTRSDTELAGDEAREEVISSHKLD